MVERAPLGLPEPDRALHRAPHGPERRVELLLLRVGVQELGDEHSYKVANKGSDSILARNNV